MKQEEGKRQKAKIKNEESAFQNDVALPAWVLPLSFCLLPFAFCLLILPCILAFCLLIF